MYFVLSKVIGFAVVPSNAVALLGLLGVALLLTRFKRTGVSTAASALVLLALFGWSPVATWLLLPLTERFPAWQATSGTPDGIIVLGGAIDTKASLARGTLETYGAAERVFAMLTLARRYPAARIIYTGGSANLILDPVLEAPIAGRVLDEFGLSNDRVILESRSRTTEENATSTRALVAPKPGERWLLVTSAWHMPRSVGLFRKVGFDVEPYPVDFQSRGWTDAKLPFERLNYGLARADIAMHEWVGLTADWLGGRSDDWFPAPRERAP